MFEVVIAGYTAFVGIKKVKNTIDALGIALKVKSAAATSAETGAEVANAGATQRGGSSTWSA